MLLRHCRPRPQPTGARPKETTNSKTRNHSNQVTTNEVLNNQYQGSPKFDNHYQGNKTDSCQNRLDSEKAKKPDSSHYNMAANIENHIKKEIFYQEKDLKVDSSDSSLEFETRKKFIEENRESSQPCFDAILPLSNAKPPRPAWAWTDDVTDTQDVRRNVIRYATSSSEEDQEPKEKHSQEAVLSVFENDGSLCSSSSGELAEQLENYPPAKSEKMPKVEDIENHRATNDGLGCIAIKDYHPGNEGHLSFCTGKLVMDYSYKALSTHRPTSHIPSFLPSLHAPYHSPSSHTILSCTFPPHTILSCTLPPHTLPPYILAPHLILHIPYTFPLHTLPPHILAPHLILHIPYTFPLHTLPPHTLPAHLILHIPYTFPLPLHTLPTHLILHIPSLHTPSLHTPLLHTSSSTYPPSTHLPSSHLPSTHPSSTQTFPPYTLPPHPLAPHLILHTPLPPHTHPLHTLSPHTPLSMHALLFTYALSAHPPSSTNTPSMHPLLPHLLFPYTLPPHLLPPHTLPPHTFQSHTPSTTHFTPISPPSSCPPSRVHSLQIPSLHAHTPSTHPLSTHPP